MKECDIYKKDEKLLLLRHVGVSMVLMVDMLRTDAVRPVSNEVSMMSSALSEYRRRSSSVFRGALA